jgi:anti-sigma factor RsiW
MTCREFIDFFIDYFEENLSARAHTEFAEHLAECPDCTAYMKSYEATIRLGKAVVTNPDAPVPSEVPEELVQAILASRHDAELSPGEETSHGLAAS